MSMEKRLSKQKRTEEFNKQFYDTVDRGVFREISEKEMREWTGPFNYIAIVGFLSGIFSPDRDDF